MSSLPSSHDSAVAIDSGTSPSIAAAAPVRRTGILSSYMELTKARLTSLVVLTTIVGYLMAAGDGFSWAILGWTVLGTALAAGCAGGLNQVFEARRDGLMVRTANRPVPAGTMSWAHAFVSSVVMGSIGVQVLIVFVNLLAGLLALLTILIYLLLYTPLKPRTTLNTLVGAVCGAIPPMIGVAAATGSLTPAAWVLGGILFIWQIPHFLALAWLYRNDYARGGFVMLPMIDKHGELTAQIVVLTSMLLIPLTLWLTMIGATGLTFAILAIVLGTSFTMLGMKLYVSRSDANARRVFLASITYLPLLLLAMVLDRSEIRPKAAVESGTQPSQVTFAPPVASDTVSGQTALRSEP